MSAIKDAFAKLRVKRNGALIGYITAGDPDPECTPNIADALIRGGIDILELGLPFSDPIADGPTIQEASMRALKAGTTPQVVLDLAKQIRKENDLPIVIMTYFNPVFKMGLERFFSVAKDSGVDGVIVPDLPVEEASDYRAFASSFGVDTIFLAAPTTTDDRLQNIVDCSSGFLYLISRFGVTGAKSSVQSSTIQLVKRVLRFTNGRIPLAVGFGVSKPDHVQSIVCAGADGVIVGSAFVDIIRRNLLSQGKMLAEIEMAARVLKEATLDSRQLSSK